MTRTANTKLLGISTKQNKVSVVSLSCETDFVSGTDLFRNFTNILHEHLLNLKYNTPMSIKEFEDTSITNNNYNKLFDNQTVIEGLKTLISKTQENCKINFIEKYDYTSNEKESNIVGIYLHTSPEGNPNLGLKGSYVVLSSNAKLDEPRLKKEVEKCANSVAMQVIASNPKYLRRSDIPNDLIENETKVIREAIQAELKEGKDPKDDIINKQLKGKINNWIKEITLLEQDFLIIDHDDTTHNKKSNVEEHVSSIGKQLGLTDLHIKEFKIYI